MTALILPAVSVPLPQPKRLTRGRVLAALRVSEYRGSASTHLNLRRWVAARLRRVSPSDLRVALPCGLTA
jgi:hypothetical protein